MAGDRVIIAKVGVGAFVRKGTAKPDISSADAFKRSMLAARSIAYPDPAGGGASGIYVAGLLERLGIAAEMKPKTKLSTLGTLYASVASGDVEIGFNQISEILAQPTIELVGPLPSEIQSYTQFVPGIVASSSQPDAGKALVTFLYSAAAKIVLKAKGFLNRAHLTCRRERISHRVPLWVDRERENVLGELCWQAGFARGTGHRPGRV